MVKCNHSWDKWLDVKKYDTVFVIYECSKCGAGKDAKTGTIYTRIGRCRFITSYKLLGDEDFEGGKE